MQGSVDPAWKVRPRDLGTFLIAFGNAAPTAFHFRHLNQEPRFVPCGTCRLWRGKPRNAPRSYSSSHSGVAFSGEHSLRSLLWPTLWQDLPLVDFGLVSSSTSCDASRWLPNGDAQVVLPLSKRKVVFISLRSLLLWFQDSADINLLPSHPPSFAHHVHHTTITLFYRRSIVVLHRQADMRVSQRSERTAQISLYQSPSWCHKPWFHVGGLHWYPVEETL